ncbi:SLIT-ROBO Rho GTPase-activating protein 1-like isoform X3 [Centruroides vittatus]|uniref:SLIT-ROBO Rho GTPase-activating protein 1-like isoform X3 n=1 Tax=Centruroides vittatus TaxID=120091 RepID=UPI00350F1539
MAFEKKNMKKEKDILLLVDGQVKDIRQQLNEQLKCLDMRMETQVAIVAEIQDYFRRRAEVELEYSRALDKLSKSLMLRHKAEKQRRDQWHLFSSYASWQHLIATTRRQSRDHAVLSEIYATHLINRCMQIMEDVQRIYKRCREIGVEGHEELLKVLHELHTTMKTYHTYHAEERQAEGKLRYVEAQRSKLEHTISREKLERSKKFRLIEKEIHKRQSKYNDAKLKALKARNEYLLCMDAANSAIHKYFVDDLSDLVNCMDFGFHTCLARTFMMHVSSEECLRKSQQSSIDGMNKCIASLDSRVDKQRFIEYNNSAFMVPKKFEFLAHKGDEVMQMCIDKAVHDEIDQRYKQLTKRLTSLKTESEEIWKTLETAERSLLDMISTKDYDCSMLFEEDGKNGLRQPETIALKLRADRQETEDFYLNKFREYCMGNNLIARLQAKADLMRKALGYEGNKPLVSGSSPNTIEHPHTLPHKIRKKRIGQTPLVGQPKLFGGSLEEYVDATNQEIPLIIQSCIRIINLYGLHHQGVFRVSGSQVEINNFRESFERGDDPLSDMTDASDINSVAGVLKLYLRELREPLFPIYYFDQLVEISLESKHEFINKVRDVVSTLPRPVYVVLRYLFAFLNHLSEFSDENMMDPYNLAICFGPTLLPIPEDKDQVQYQNLVNELVKNLIIYQEEIFMDDGGIVYEKYISTNVPDENDVGESPLDQASDHLDSEADILPSEDEGETLEAIAQFDFTARSERELSFKKGDTILLYSQVSNDWWKGSFCDHNGLIPDKYILLKIKDEDKESCDKRRTSSSSDSLTGVSPKTYSDYGSSERSTDGHYGESQSNSSLNPTKTSGESLSSHSKLQVPVSSQDNHFAHSSNADESLEDTFKVDASDFKSTSSQYSSNERKKKELSDDLDSALAKVFCSINTLEEKTEKRSHTQCQDTPDLVMDLPINPSSPTTGCKDSSKESLDKSECANLRNANRSSDSPEMTAAERFAMSNQCTMKKGSMSRSASHVSSLPRSSDAQTQTFRTVKRSASTGTDFSPSSSPQLTVQGKDLPEVKNLEGLSESVGCQNEVKVETVEITWTSPHKKADIVPQPNEESSDARNVVSGGVSTFKPPVKVKPPVMKKPTIIPSPEPSRRSQEREFKQTSF